MNGPTINRQTRRLSMKAVIISSVASLVAATCGAGNIFSLAAIKLGAGELYLGIFNFLSIAPFLLGLCTMSAIEIYGKRKIIIKWYWLSAVFFAPILLLPLAASYWPAWACLAMLAAANASRNAAIALGSTGWFPILQDIVPRRLTGRFFARLRTTWQSASTLSLLAAALVLWKFPSWLGFEIVFLIAFAGEIARNLPLPWMAENPPLPNPVCMTVWQRLREFAADSTMRHYSLYLTFYFLASMAMEPFKIKLLSDLGYSSGVILASTAMVGIGAILSLSLWGKIADKFGNRAIFGITHIGMIVSTAAWVFVWPSSTWAILYVCGLYLFWSAFNSGVNLAMTNYMLRVVPREKQNFLTFILLVQRMVTAVAPLLAGLVLEFTPALKFRIASLPLSIYDLLFIACAALFLVPHFMRKKLKAPTDTPTANVITKLARKLAQASRL
ncbi:MAG: hypothetical protein A2Y07_01755 [Planctomycetes bacterium GWF2_50_10]|nr:MAG: hypothetical protein A2Y07_01755 [Planctomycetes bacterium GWF2_50_10]